MPHTYDYTKAKIGQTIFRFAGPDDPILQTAEGEFLKQADGELGLDLTKEFLELHFYHQNTNPPEIAKSVVIPLSRGDLHWRLDDAGGTGNSGWTSSTSPTDKQIVGLQYGSTHELDFETIQLGLKLWDKERPLFNIYNDYLNDMPAETYDVLINFFSSELGPVNDTNLGMLGSTWRIAQISDTFPEIILEPVSRLFDPHTNTWIVENFDMTEFEQFVDTSIFAKDFKTTISTKFQRNKFDTAGNSIQYKAIRDHIVAAIQTMSDQIYQGRTWAYIEQYYWDENSRNEVVKPLINEIIGEIFISIDDWVDGEIEEKRFRITDMNFENFITNKVDEILGVLNNSDSYINKFPEPGTLFVNE